jgi:uncharacterized protein (TIGR02284 family)
MTDARLIAMLNDLIEASKDGEKGFALAARDTREPDLARAFRDGETASRAAAADLQDQVRLLGATEEQEGSMGAAARRRWVSVRALVSPRDDATIMEEVERGERYVRGRYAEALDLDLPASLRTIVERHHRAIVEGHYRVVDLRNRFRDSSVRAYRVDE